MKLILLLSLILLGCSEIIEESKSKLKSIFTSDDQYVLTGYMVETQEPSFVNIMFQVSDGDGKGVDSLLTKDFIVLEDDKAVSPTESAMKIMKKDAIPYKLKTVIMLDNSASVGDNIVEIRRAALSLVESMVEKQEIALYVFSETPKMIQDFTSEKEVLIKAINQISLGFATTNLYGSVIEGTSRWNDNYSTTKIEQGFMILITDGSDTQASHSLNEASIAINKKLVYTIGLGKEQDKEALSVLGTAGYFSLGDYTELSNKFFEIQNDMKSYSNSFYWLYYMSPKRGHNKHTIKLILKNNLNNDESSYVSGYFLSTDFYSSNTIENPDVIETNSNSSKLKDNNSFQSNNIQDYVPKELIVVEEQYEDLNKDGLIDCLLLVKGTDEKLIVYDESLGELDRNRRGLIVLFKEESGYKSVIQNYECFSSENEDGGVYFAPELSIRLNKGNLYVNYSHGRYGAWNYTFRYQNYDFELIGFDRIYKSDFVSELNSFDEVSYNFSTKKKLVKNVIGFDNDGKEKYKETWSKFSIYNLIKLSEIDDFDELDVSY